MLDELEEGQRRLAIAVEQWEERIEHLRFARVVALPTRRRLLAHRAVDLESQLDPSRFVRIHRSYLVNVERIAKIEPYAKDSRVAVLGDGTQLPMSRAGYARIKER